MRYPSACISNTAESSREWTLADLAGLDQPGTDQIAEALALRDRRA